MASDEPVNTAVLINWVKQYKDQNDGRLPTPNSIPSDLAPVYFKWLESVRSGAAPQKAVPCGLEPSDRGQAAPNNKDRSIHSLEGSLSVDTHVSDTPIKSARTQRDVECTSAPTPAVPLFHDDFQAERPQPFLKSSSGLAKKPSARFRQEDAENHAKPRRRTRAPNKENDTRQQSPLPAQSPLRDAVLRSPLLPSHGHLAQQSPSRVRQGAVKRKVTFLSFARKQQQPLAPVVLCSDVAAAAGGAGNSELQAPAAASSQQQPQPESAGRHQLPEEPSVGPSDREKASEADSDGQVAPAGCHLPSQPVAKAPTEHASTSVQPGIAVSREGVSKQNGTALRRKRKASPCEAEPSGSDVGLVCSETLSSEVDSDMSADECESGSQNEGDRKADYSQRSAKRARPSVRNNLTVAQLKERLKERGLSTTGKKADLGEQLKIADSGIAEESQPAACSSRSAVGDAEGPRQHKSLRAKKPSAGVFKGGKRKNFVRINLKGPSAKGKFQSKGARKFGKKRFSRFGRFQTKMLPQAGQGADYVEGCSMRSMACFKCGADGHFARDCPGLPDAADKPLDDDAEETAQLASSVAPPLAVPAAAAVQLPEESIAEEALTVMLQSVFGFSAFRGLQLPVIQSVLRGTSTLAVLPTGAGKSLCYQVPALLCGGLVLVVSPLIALMKDQLAHLPKGLPGAMLWSGQQAAQAMQTLRDVREGNVRVLYVAPERMGSPSLLSALAPMLPLPLVCIDEAHCIAEWGHNFRSAYFRLGRMLRENIPCRAVLALTATATKATEASMIEALGIDPSAVFRDASLRDNLRFHVHHTNGGTEAGHSKTVLLKLLRPAGALADKKAVVVYTTFQMQAEQVAAHLHSHGIPAAAYHAGKHFKERESVQEMFGKGRLRVVVATVAFGMGVDAGGVQAVVHMTLPQSLEEYVQQVGRAGRDGSEAQCHLFLDDADFRRLRSLSHSDAVSAASVLQFLETVFDVDDSEGSAATAECSRYAVLGADELACSLDMKVEVMETLLTYLEAHEETYVRVLPSVGRTAKVSFFASTCQALAPRNPSLQSLLDVCSKPRGGNYTVHMARWANAAGMAPSALLQQLAALARQDELRFEVDAKPTLTFQVGKRPASLDKLAEELAARHTEVGRRRLRRLDTVYKMLAAAAAKSDQAAQEHHIREVAQRYFEAEDDTVGAGQSATEVKGLPLVPGSNFMAKDVRMLLRESASMKVGAQLTGRAIARILHGLSSSAFPATQWKKCGYWGRYGNVDFDAVLAVAEAELEAVNSLK